MKDRGETVKMAVISGTRSDSGPPAYCQYVKVTNREDARKRGHIRGRSRSFINDPGCCESEVRIQWGTAKTTRLSRNLDATS